MPPDWVERSWADRQMAQFASPAITSLLKPHPHPRIPHPLDFMGQGDLYQFNKKGDSEAACQVAVTLSLRSQPSSSANAASVTDRTKPSVSTITAEACKRSRGPAGQYHNFRPILQPREPRRFCVVILGPPLAPFCDFASVRLPFHFSVIYDLISIIIHNHVIYVNCS